MADKYIGFSNLGYYAGVGIKLGGNWFNTEYYDYPIEDKFKEAVKISAVYLILAGINRGVGEDSFRLDEVNLLLSRVLQSPFKDTEVGEGTDIHLMYPRWKTQEKSHLDVNAEIHLRNNSLIFIFESIFVDSEDFLRTGAYTCKGKRKYLFMDHRLTDLKDSYGSSWDLMFLHLVASVISLEGYIISDKLMRMLATSVSVFRVI